MEAPIPTIIIPAITMFFTPESMHLFENRLLLCPGMHPTPPA